MALDTSIYQNIQPIQTPSIMDAAGKAMNLSQMAMQNQQSQMAIESQQAMRDAYANHVGSDGSVDQNAVLSDLAKKNPQAYMMASQQINQMKKAQAESESAQADALEKRHALAGPGFGYVAEPGITPQEQLKRYPIVYNQWSQNGLPMTNVPKPDEDPDKIRDWIQSSNAIFQNSVSGLAAKKAQAETQNKIAETASIPSKVAENLSNVNKNNAEPFKLGAAELEKFKDDVANPSVRKAMGALNDTRTRADRVITLLNSGAQPNETPDQRIARLDKLMPQVGTEIGTSLAAIMQGGVPNESLMKEIDPDTVNAKLADLKQKYLAEPSAANQGAILNAYGDIAKKLRSFSADQMAQSTSRIRQAYPNAEKYFPDRMDKIAAPLSSPPESTQTSGKSESPRQAPPPGMVWMKSPKSGNIIPIPISQKREAIASGGSVVQ